MSTATFFAKFTTGGGGRTGLSPVPTVDITAKNRVTGATALVVDDGVMTEEGDGYYYYQYTSADPGNYTYTATATTSASDVDDQTPDAYMASTHEEILLAMRTLIRALDLETLDDGHVWIRPVVIDRNLKLPGVVLAPWGPEDQKGGTNQRDDIEYGIAVAIIAPGNQEVQNATVLRTCLRWRQRIFSYFRNQRFPQPVDSSWKVRVQTMAVVDEKAFLDLNLLVSGLVLWVTNREARG